MYEHVNIFYLLQTTLRTLDLYDYIEGKSVKSGIRLQLQQCYFVYNMDTTFDFDLKYHYCVLYLVGGCHIEI